MSVAKKSRARKLPLLTAIQQQVMAHVLNKNLKKP
jgi:hypothetical protein